MLADEGQDHVALPDAVLNELPEVRPGRDRVGVEEDRAGAEVKPEGIVQPPCEARRVVATI